MFLSFDTQMLMFNLVETRGRTLEEMSRLFGIESRLAERSGVKPASDAKDPSEEHVEDLGSSSRS